MPKFNIKNIASTFGLGFLPELAPYIVKGLLIEYLSGVDIKELDKWIEQDVSLWSKIDRDYHEDIRGAVSKIGDLKWFTSDWLKEGLRKDLPTLCSLFLASDKASDWLDRQIAEIKAQVTTVVS